MRYLGLDTGHSLTAQIAIVSLVRQKLWNHYCELAHDRTLSFRSNGPGISLKCNGCRILEETFLKNCILCQTDFQFSFLKSGALCKTHMLNLVY